MGVVPVEKPSHASLALGSVHPHRHVPWPDLLWGETRGPRPRVHTEAKRHGKAFSSWEKDLLVGMEFREGMRNSSGSVTATAYIYIY